MEEIWKEVPFDARYKVSNKGNIKSLVYGYERLLKPVLGHTGYYFVRIKSKAYMVHRLVALAFIPTKDTLLHIDHKDGNKLNNNVDNLRWCTQKENNNNPITKERISKALLGSKRTEEQKQRMKEAQQKAKPMLGKHHSKETLEKFKYKKNGMKGKFGKYNPNSKPVAMLDINGNILKMFANSLIAFQQHGIDRGSICKCCNGKRKTAGGYKWKYIE
jgi:hypothetical protein